VPPLYFGDERKTLDERSYHVNRALVKTKWRNFEGKASVPKRSGKINNRAAFVKGDDNAISALRCCRRGREETWYGGRAKGKIAD